MATKLSLIIFSLLLLCSCSEKSGDTKEHNVDSVASAKVSATDTTGYVGRWKASYTEYSYKFDVDLEIKKSETESCPDYFCVWTAKDQFGGQRKTYTWCLKYEYGDLFGTGSMNVDNTVFTISRNWEKEGAPYVAIRFPGRTESWDVEFEAAKQ